MKLRTVVSLLSLNRYISNIKCLTLNFLNRRQGQESNSYCNAHWNSLRADICALNFCLAVVVLFLISPASEVSSEVTDFIKKKINLPNSKNTPPSFLCKKQVIFLINITNEDSRIYDGCDSNVVGTIRTVNKGLSAIAFIALFYL